MRKGGRKKIISLLIVLLFTIKGFTQIDPIMTQYMFNMQAINPAYAGMWEKVGFSSLVRKQWAGIDKTPLTELISFHTPMRNEFVGVGLNVMNDHFGFENRLSIFGDYSYEISLTPKTRLRFGLKFGFMNYKNPLTQLQLYPDQQDDPAFAEDIDLKFLPNFGFGAFLYEEDYYVSFSIPRLVENDFKTNINNYSSQAEVRTLYLGGGYIFRLTPSDNLIFKPTILIRATVNNPLQYDLGLNFMLRETIWLGGMYRSGDAVCFTSQIILGNNLKIGFAIDITYTEIYPYQFGTYEFSLGYDIDFYGRSYVRSKYF